MSHLLRCDLAWNISFSSHVDDRLLHFGLWGFHAHLLPRVLYQVAIWQFDDSVYIFQERCRHSSELPTHFPLLNKIRIVWLSNFQTFSDQRVKTEPLMQRNAIMCQRMNVSVVFCINYNVLCACICHLSLTKWASDPHDLQRKMGRKGLSETGMHTILNATCLSLEWYAIWNHSQMLQGTCFLSNKWKWQLCVSVPIFCIRTVCSS